MNDKELLAAVIRQLSVLQQEHMRTVARVKALEMVISLAASSPEHAASWKKQLDEQTNRCLQVLLEEYEKHSPALGAALDNRKPREMEGL